MDTTHETKLLRIARDVVRQLNEDIFLAVSDGGFFITNDEYSYEYNYIERRWRVKPDGTTVPFEDDPRFKPMN